MAKSAYCGGCGRRVTLTESGECPQGHIRSMLRDIREGEAPASPAQAAPARPVPAAPADDQDDLVAGIIGKAVVFVPLALIVAFALWTGYLQMVESGHVSTWVAVLGSVGSLLGTVLLAVALAKKGRS